MGGGEIPISFKAVRCFSSLADRFRDTIVSLEYPNFSRSVMQALETCSFRNKRFMLWVLELEVDRSWLLCQGVGTQPAASKIPGLQRQTAIAGAGSSYCYGS